MIYLFKDLGPHCKDPQIVRLIRDLYFSPNSRLWTLILLDAVTLPSRRATPYRSIRRGMAGRRRTHGNRAQDFQEAQRNSLHAIESTLTKRELELLVQTLCRG